MEKKSRLWLWILVSVLCLMAIGGGVWFGLRGREVKINEEDLSKYATTERTEKLVVSRGWNSKTLVFSFESEEGSGEFKIDFKSTAVVLTVSEGSWKEGLKKHNLLSVNSPYWETAFCLGDVVVMELSDAFFNSDKSLSELRGEDVKIITNLGASSCRIVK